ncbi:MAG: hypothetical protein KatS3mg111_3463 [Pirellulaceae bacterium]|nr:MAG: hypothetical protein KatS3mg111_3463 [Pirellulaceae bacterium]
MGEPILALLATFSREGGGEIAAGSLLALVATLPQAGRVKDTVRLQNTSLSIELHGLRQQKAERVKAVVMLHLFAQLFRTENSRLFSPYLFARGVPILLYRRSRAEDRQFILQHTMSRSDCSPPRNMTVRFSIGCICSQRYGSVVARVELGIPPRTLGMQH